MKRYDPTAKRAYDSKWRVVRLAILERDHYRCTVGLPKCKGVATQVDHIVPLSEGGARLEADNLRACCSACNAARQNTRNAQLAAALEPQTTTGRPSRAW